MSDQKKKKSFASNAAFPAMKQWTPLPSPLSKHIQHTGLWESSWAESLLWPDTDSQWRRAAIGKRSITSVSDLLEWSNIAACGWISCFWTEQCFLYIWKCSGFPEPEHCRKWSPHWINLNPNAPFEHKQLLGRGLGVQRCGAYWGQTCFLTL